MFPDQGWTPDPLHWEHGVLDTGSPVKSLIRVTFDRARASGSLGDWRLLWLFCIIWPGLGFLHLQIESRGVLLFFSFNHAKKINNIKSDILAILECTILGFPGGSVVKNQPANTENAGLIPGLGTSPGEGNDNPLQCYCLENPMDRGAWQATVRGVAKSQTWLSD